jgi:hypothetical protein
MAPQAHPEPGEWRLGPEMVGSASQTSAQPSPAIPPDRSAERLERPILVVTAERLAWMLTIVYAIAVRLVGLGARPLDTGEASRSIDAFKLGTTLAGASLKLAPQLWLRNGWIGLADAGVIWMIGPTDFSARILFALSGIALVLLMLALRPRIGRAGTLASAVLIATSPAFTWFSRSASPQMTALVFLMGSIVLFLAIVRRPRSETALVFGLLAGLTMASGPIMVGQAAVLALALGLIGLWTAFVRPHPWLDVQIWWRRRGAVALVAVITSVLVWLGFATACFTRPFPTAFVGTFPGIHAPSIGAMLSDAAAVYDFLIVLGAMAGLVTIFATTRSRFAAFIALWALGSLVLAVVAVPHAQGDLVNVLLPLALMAGIAIEWLHHRRAWIYLRYGIAALVLITLWMQIATTLIWFAPDPSEPSWSHHATLFWTTPATSVDVPAIAARLRNGLENAPSSVYFAKESSVMRWYLRDLAVSATPDAAGIIIGTDTPPTGWVPAGHFHFAIAQGLAIGSATIWNESPSVIAFALLSMRPLWPLVSKPMDAMVRAPAPRTRTWIVAPGASTETSSPPSAVTPGYGNAR